MLVFFKKLIEGNLLKEKSECEQEKFISVITKAVSYTAFVFEYKMTLPLYWL